MREEESARESGREKVRKVDIKKRERGNRAKEGRRWRGTERERDR